jgi:hypothetical protein
MKIGILDGSIAFDAGKILPTQDRENFLDTNLGRDATRELVNKEWWHIGIKPEPGVAATLIYRFDRLDSVYLLMEMPTDRDDEWTMERELQRKLKHDNWLQRELGPPPYKYPWGVVASEFDAKACVSEIIIAYGH